MDTKKLSILKKIRSNFLKDSPSKTSDYWSSLEHLEAYDEVFARRILWKWNAVITELEHRQVSLPRGPILDYGSGTGVACEAVSRAWQGEFLLFDRSSLAMRYASEKLTTLNIKVKSIKDPGQEAYSTFLASHVLSEMESVEFEQFLACIKKARFLILVEAGTPEVARRLSRIREELLGGTWYTVAPCTHNESCPLLNSTQDWCHFFAKPPSEIFIDSKWGKIGSELGIDLRSLPLSYLVMSRDPVHLEGGRRLIGRVRQGAKASSFYTCGSEGFSLHQEKMPKKDLKLIEKNPFLVKF